MDLHKDCLDAMGMVMVAGMQPKAAGIAQRTLMRILESVGSREDTESLELRALALYNLAQVYELLKLPEEARKSREEANSHLARVAAPGTLLELEDQLTGKLMSMGKYSQAIPFCLQAIKLSGRVANSNMAIRLWRAGQCFLRCGFHAQAETPLRKALEIFREAAGDPRVPALLLELGNSLRRRDPRKSYECQLEAATIWENGKKLDQAAAAWHNLGLLCADEHRYDEALSWYEKARKVREADTASPERLGLLYNNIANVYRGMGDFERAHQEIQRALTLLEPAARPGLANAYGSLGLIFRDQGADEEALPWLHKARTEDEKQTNPNIANLIEKLENEAGVLKRLGRLPDAVTLENEITRLRELQPQAELPDLSSVKALQPDGDGAVLIELHNQSLPDAVYKQFDVSTLEDRLEDAIERAAVGEYDGNEFGPEGATIFLYGPDAEELFRVIEPILRDYPLCEGARVRIRQNDHEREIVITTSTTH